MRSTRLDVDVDQFIHNIKLIQDYVGDKTIMPVIKANAYGTYLNKRLDILEKFSIVGVAIVDEGIEIRKLGYKGDVFVLNQPSVDEIDSILDYDLTIGLSDYSFLEKCKNLKKNLKVHLEIETGMNRTGISISDLDSFLELVSHSSIDVLGVYSHLSSADFDSSYTNRQVSIFKDAISIIKSHSISLKYIHIEASSGLLNLNLDFTNIVRPGILIYGYEPFVGAYDIIPVKPICRFYTFISFLKEVSTGEAIGYSQTYKCPKNMFIATIPVGYADGYRRSLSNKGYVSIHGEKAPIVGNVCMDSFMVDVSHISNVKVGDEVFLFDIISFCLDEFSSLCDTISYEILSTISSRVPRIFIGGNNEKRS